MAVTPHRGKKSFHVKRSLPVLCPQEYHGIDMRAVTCSRCANGWNNAEKRCTILTGAEHLDDEPTEEVPDCPIQDRCQHQIQTKTPCVVRRKGLICESALIESGLTPDEAANHERSFNADLVVTPEEYAERKWLNP
jgi:hypothetical protein